MKLCLIGYGKMGKAVEAAAIQRNHSIISRISPNNPASDFHEIHEHSLQNADVCIDFSHPKAVASNARSIVEKGKNLVIGTTGWDKNLEEIQNLSKKFPVGILYSANFSLGVNAFYRIIEHAAKLFQHFEQYDVSGLESHHKNKVDSPSGTAKFLSAILLKNLERKSTCVSNIENRAIAPQELHFNSIRCGCDPGTHTITFDSPCDSISLTHKARNRDGFAMGSIIAAEWLVNKKGLYTFRDMIDEFLQKGFSKDSQDQKQNIKIMQ